MVIFLQAVANGLLLGGVYGLVSVGLTLIFGVMRIVNFAHGEFLMLGMFAAYWLARLFDLNPYLVVLPAGLLLFLAGVLTQRLLIDRVLGQTDEAQILLTVGLSAFLQGGALFVWGADYRTVVTPLATASLALGSVFLSIPRLIAFGVAMLLAAGLYLLLTQTDLGKAMRAAAENREVAVLLGIDTRGIFLIAFGIGTALVGVAGALMVPVLATFPTVGTLFTLTAFVVVVLGGAGDIVGAMIGGGIIGVTEALIATYVALDLAPVATFLIFLLILLVRPQGLFGTGRV
ncbi:MAG TPA: branched-chain amino acid ABC transporter permease [bacterium]|nr:branched-chain amino acid ABC transporter permease [bacterium]